MEPRAVFYSLFLAIVLASPARAAVDPDRLSAIGTDDGIRIEARLTRDTISSGVTIGVTYEVHNLTRAPIALAPRQCSASYDRDSRTITLSIGSEVPDPSLRSRLVTIPSGATRTFTAGAPLPFAPGSGPRHVQITVNVVRGWSTPAGGAVGELVDEWLEHNTTIMLNALPVYYTSERASVEFR